MSYIPPTAAKPPCKARLVFVIFDGGPGKSSYGLVEGRYKLMKGSYGLADGLPDGGYKLFIAHRWNGTRIDPIGSPRSRLVPMWHIVDTAMNNHHMAEFETLCPDILPKLNAICHFHESLHPEFSVIREGLAYKNPPTPSKSKNQPPMPPVSNTPTPISSERPTPMAKLQLPSPPPITGLTGLTGTKPPAGQQPVNWDDGYHHYLDGSHMLDANGKPMKKGA
jgi:hypothetical protein